MGRDQGNSSNLGAGTTTMVFRAGSICSACCHGEGEPRVNFLLCLGGPLKGQSPLRVCDWPNSYHRPTAWPRREKESNPSPSGMGDGTQDCPFYTSIHRGEDSVSQEETKVLTRKGEQMLDNPKWQMPIIPHF